MSQLKRFFQNVTRDETPSTGAADFQRLPKLEVESHLTVSQYGPFTLSEAIRPSFDLRIIPREGFRHDRYRDEQARTSIPVLMASVSAERLFETFIELLEPLGDVVDVVLETSHRRSGDGHADFYRDRIDRPILESYLYEYEDLFMDDGCTGIAALNPSVPFEVQLDEHKMLIVYAEELEPFEQILRSRGIRQDESIRFLTEAEHVHTTRDEYYRRFRELQSILGIDEDF